MEALVSSVPNGGESENRPGAAWELTTDGDFRGS